VVLRLGEVSREVSECGVEGGGSDCAIMPVARIDQVGRMGRIGRSGISARSRTGGYSKRRWGIGEGHEARKGVRRI
jgi:hypothetical protein